MDRDLRVTDRPRRLDPILRLAALFVVFLALTVLSSPPAQGEGSPSPATYAVTIDSQPRVASILVDGVLYLPSQQPVVLEWEDLSNHTFSIVESTVTAGSGKRYVFEQWNDLERDANRSVTITGEKWFFGLFKPQYFLTVISPHGAHTGMGWYDQGAVANFSVPTTVSIVENWSRQVFVGWDRGFKRFFPENSIEINEPTTVTASWKAQHWLEVTSSVPEIAVTGTGWYDEGSNAQISTMPELEVKPQEQKYVFKRWVSVGTNTPSGSLASESMMIKVSSHYQIMATWETMWYLTVKSSPPDLISGKEDGWYPSGAIIRIAKPTEENSEYKFSEWLIDGWPSVESSPSVTMNQSHLVLAKFGRYYSLSFDTYPRTSALMIDGYLYLPNSLPKTFRWLAGSEHRVVLPSTEAIVDAGQRYVFTRWIDLDISTSRTIIVDRDANYIALFKPQYYLTVISQYDSPIGEGWYDSGSLAYFSVEPLTDVVENWSRQVFVGWDRGFKRFSPENSIEINEPTTVTASWKAQHWLEVTSSVPEIAVTGTGWYDEGSNALITTKEQFESVQNGHKYTFLHWETLGPGIAPVSASLKSATTVAVDKPYRIVAEWQEWWYLKLHSSQGKAQGEGYHLAGSFAEASVPSVEEVLPDQERWTFAGWIGDASSPSPKFAVLMNDSKTLNAVWKRQYHLKVNSEYGNARGSGWYDEGSTASISVTESIELGLGRQMVFEEWVGDYRSGQTTGVLVMDKPYSVTALWRVDETLQSAMLLSSSGAAGIFVMLLLGRELKRSTSDRENCRNK